MKDLVIIVADKNLEHALNGLLSRPEALGIRAIETDIYRHPQHDPGCAVHGVEFISNFAGQYSYGLLMFDHEGSGKETTTRLDLQESLNESFAISAWGERARAIVLAPELEVWIWGDSRHVDEVAGWQGRDPGLRRWLVEQDYLQEGEVKPMRPKEAFEAALREARKPRSASLYLQIAEKVSLRRCTDSAFLELKSILADWFPPEGREHSA
ncbi:MAG: hypothetical protein OXL41_07450 [Nitrospinae bacterium]|nr:hypothetical protein [Nitrospinota bacterium]